MNVKRFVLSFIAVYVLNFLLGFLIHQLWLGETYAQLAHVWRPEEEMMSLMWVMWITGAAYALFFCYLFVLGYQQKGIAEGIRYGLVVGVLVSIPVSFDSFVIYPVPFSLAVKWFISSVGISILGGVVLALIYRPKPAPA